MFKKKHNVLGDTSGLHHCRHRLFCENAAFPRIQLVRLRSIIPINKIDLISKLAAITVLFVFCFYVYLFYIAEQTVLSIFYYSLTF